MTATVDYFFLALARLLHRHKKRPIDKYKKGEISQLWTFKENFFFNQGKVMDVEGAKKEHAVPIQVYPRKTQDNANQKWQIMKIYLM